MEKCSSNSSYRAPTKVSGSFLDVQAQLLDSWFPVNPELLSKIRSGLDSGSYKEDVNLLIEELKGDFSLFTYCLRELTRLAQSGAQDYKPPENPIDLLRTSGFEQLRSVLVRSEEQISSHRLQDMTSEQAGCIRSSMISATVASTLSERQELPAELGYCCALLRQLGLTLIAWNYPHIFQRALCTLEEGQKIDQALSTVLGFSPSLLGVSFARKWGLSATVRRAVGDKQICDQPSTNPEVDLRGAALERICELGEILAQASAPDDYPLTDENWESARKQVEDKLGELGFELLQERIFKACETYLNYAPHIFELPKWDRKPPPPPTQAGAYLLSRNIYLTQCPAKLRSAIERVYVRLDGKTVVKDLVVTVCREIVPLGGFPRGCIYLIDPDSQALVARMPIGTSRLADFDPFSLKDSNNLIVRALHSKAPLQVGRDGKEQDDLIYKMAAVLGDVQRSGVLLLEVAKSLHAQHGVNIQGRFKALRHLINDVLNLY